MKNKVILIIRDGYGRRDSPKDNAVVKGKTPYNDHIIDNYPHCMLRTSGEDVGLPKGFMGGSEVGHITIGSGRVVPQSLKRIDNSINNKTFYENKAFLKVIEKVKENNSTLHLAGLLQDQGVHSHQKHLFELLKLANEKGVEDIAIHVFSDGRDSPTNGLKQYMKDLEKVLEKQKGYIATIIGRFYAMDRDTRWDRTKKAYDLIVKGEGNKFTNPNKAIEESYKENITDEFIEPKVNEEYNGMKDGDGLILYNYRTDRVRQLTKSIVEPNFDEFETESKKIHVACMTQYYENVNAEVAFEERIPENTLGDVISQNNLKQLRISETEKYPHVTFFFNGQAQEEKKGEERRIINSPREVKTYDEKPEMSIYEVTKKLEKELEKEYSLIVVNLVNGDMVGHTGSMEAAVKAVEAVDDCLKKIVEKGLERGYDSIVFADHGNCEEMEGVHKTSHTLNDVDCILVSNKEELQKDKIKLKYGGLKDIAPTTLELFGLKKPKEMTGENLIEK